MSGLLDHLFQKACGWCHLWNGLVQCLMSRRLGHLEVAGVNSIHQGTFLGGFGLQMWEGKEWVAVCSRALMADKFVDGEG